MKHLSSLAQNCRISVRILNKLEVSCKIQLLIIKKTFGKLLIKPASFSRLLILTILAHAAN